MSFARNRREFDSICASALAVRGRDQRVELAVEAIRFAIAHPTGYYSSDTLEGIFLEAAREIQLPLSEGHREATVLHVMTESYQTGGHTRVVERWVELDSSHSHSVVFTANEHQLVPPRLRNAVQASGGRLVRLPDSDDRMEKAAKLRSLASEYEFVVLHIHMHDAVPLIAFGTEDFTRPVIFFNHADHSFSVGVAVADKFVDYRSWGVNLSREYRGVAEPFLLPLPMEVKEDISGLESDILRTLRVPAGKKVVVTAGAAEKYRPTGKWSFSSLAAGILKQEDRVLLAIGIDDSHAHWRSISAAFRGRAFGVGVLNHEDFKACLAASDIVIDSYPVGGNTTLIDALSLGKPVLSLSGPDAQMDYIRSSPAYCSSREELFSRTDFLLAHPSERRKHVEAVTACLVANNSVKVWRERIAELYGSLAGRRHEVHGFRSVLNQQPGDLDVFLAGQNQSTCRRIMQLDYVKENAPVFFRSLVPRVLGRLRNLT